MPSIATVIDFVLTNRRYEFVRKCGGDIVVLKKIGNDDRDWHHFKTFKVHKDWYRFKKFKDAAFSSSKQTVLSLAGTTGTERILRRIKSKIPLDPCLVYGPQLAPRCSALLDYFSRRRTIRRIGLRRLARPWPFAAQIDGFAKRLI